MPKITIRHRSNAQIDQAGSFAATVIVDDRTEHEITVRNPFDEKQERDLEFYFEEWIQFPFDEDVRARRAATSVKDYGEALFEDVFGGRKAYSDYQQACEDGLSALRIEIEGDSPAFQALHWEALKDPDLPRPLAVDCVFVRRKRLQGGRLRVRMQPSSEINLLVVTARPDEEKDVGYRTISRPLIEAIERGKLPVKVELLRPGTFEALSEHLEEKGEGFYHIVHFDAHGGLMTHAQYLAGTKRNRYVYQARRGRRDMEPYEGKKSFLFLEGSEKEQAEPVEAQELADLLVNKGIPVCVLNACQSGKQVGGLLPDSEMRETSLGARLMTAGIQTVVAMGYSVTVSAAELMMGRLYGVLVAEKGVPEAIRLGRRELHEEKNRRVYFNQIVDLEDWLLPVVYANGEVDLRLEPLSGRARAEALTARARRYRFEKPTYGFVGRDLEILKIEKALLRHNVLLLQGMGGTGKTTLLNYLREWWQTTGFVREVFYFGYDEGAHTLQQMLRVMGKRLCADEYAFAEFEAMPTEAQMVDVADRLRAEAYGVVLDNLESVTGQALAIQNTLPEEERDKVKDFLMRLRGGQTKVVLGSRSPEAWLKETFTFEGQENQYELSGLDPESRTMLAEKILASTSLDHQWIAEIRKDKAFRKLMKLLAGYPLAMEVVLGNLARQSPQEVLDGLDAADVESFDVGGEEKTNNILKCVEYSHSKLSADAQKLLVCLAPFSGFVDRHTLPRYIEELSKREPLRHLKFEKFSEAIQETVDWGLLCPRRNGDNRILRIQPVLPYFLRIKLHNSYSLEREAIYNAFKIHYRKMTVGCQQLLSSTSTYQENQQQYALQMCRLEYENFYYALRLSLRDQERIDIFFCLSNYLSMTGRRADSLSLAQEVCQQIDHYPESFIFGCHGHQVMGGFDSLAISYLAVGDHENAEINYRKALSILSNLNCYSAEEKERQKANITYQLGSIKIELRQYKKSKPLLQQALKIFSDRHELTKKARTYHQMGYAAYGLRHYEVARSHHERAYKIFKSFNEKVNQGKATYHIGITEIGLQNYQKARAYLRLSRFIFHRFNDYFGKALVNYQLGIIACKLEEYKQARKFARQVLDDAIRFNAHYHQSSAHYLLGMATQGLKEWDQAVAHYTKALKLQSDFGNTHNKAEICFQLGNLERQLENYTTARKYLLLALSIFARFEDEDDITSTMKSLSHLYRATQDRSLLVDVTRGLSSTEEEVSQLFEKLNSA